MAIEPKPPLRIGVTMRVTEADGYKERRDALAHDWPEFLRYALPEASWVPLPNLGAPILGFVERWSLNGFILTGGNDVGEVELKDETDCSLLEWAQLQGLPVFGVCRGLQVIHHFFGGRLSPFSAGEHVARRHGVLVDLEAQLPGFGSCEEQVNSYHRFGVRKADLSPVLIPVARTADGWIEGVKLATGRLQAVMWHPERERPFKQLDRNLIRSTFGVE